MSGNFLEIGKVAKALRTESKLTLQVLSEKTGISIGFLSQFERGQATIAIDTLAKIAGVYNRPISYFLPLEAADFKEKNQKYDLVRSYERQLKDVDLSFVQYNLLNNPSAANFLPRYYEILPNRGEDRTKRVQYEHEGLEFIYVLEGILDVVVEGEGISMNPGDSILLNSKKGHTWENNTTKSVRILTVHTPNPLATEKP